MPRLSLKFKKEDIPTADELLSETELSPEGRALVEEVGRLADELLAPEKEPAEPMTGRQAKNMRRAANILYIATVALSLLLGVTLLISRFAPSGVMGVRFFVELTNAMLREVPRGSLLVTVMRTSDKIKPGDIITYNALPGDPDSPRLTRIVEERLKRNNQTLFRTKRAGDAAPDSILINMSSLLGVKLLVIPGAGYVLSFMQTYAAGLAVLAAALCVAAAVLRRWAVLEYPGLKRRRKRKGRVQRASV